MYFKFVQSLYNYLVFTSNQQVFIVVEAKLPMIQTQASSKADVQGR